MELTGIEEQVAAKTRRETKAELDEMLKPLMDFISINSLHHEKTPFQVRDANGQFRQIDHAQHIKYRLVDYLTDLVIKKRTQKALDKIVAKLLA